MRKVLGKGLVLSTALSVVIACSDNDSDGLNMVLEPRNMESLGDDFEYEGWIIVDDEAVSTGTFDINEDGEVEASSSFRISDEDAEGATDFVLTIEPSPDPDPAPSNVHIIAGEIVGNVTEATTDHVSAFDSDFMSIAGTYMLTTPTNGNATPTQGIWYLDNSSGSPVASLTLPTLPDGWIYEGWIVTGDGPVSTGTFRTANMADSDGAGPTAGTMPSPNYPGQDFITPPVDLVGLMAVISIEPVPDNSPSPFSIKPLTGVISQPESALEQNLGTLPSATVSIE